MSAEVLVGLIAAGAIIGFLIWWLIFESEGVYLGQRVVIWLYDVYASRYDTIKSNDEIEEHLYLAVPLLEAIAPHNNPMVLDVAAGTGRIGLALCQHPDFEGKIIALDLSLKMLTQGARSFAEMRFTEYIQWIHAAASPLPLQDVSFDVVTCMEALEFMPDAQQTLQEIVRVLRPGGLLLTTRRINTRWMPGRTWTEDRMRTTLEQLGLISIRFETWQRDYDLVWACKAGNSRFLGPQGLEAVLRCPACQHALLINPPGVDCPHCQRRFLFNRDGILRLAAGHFGI